MISLLGLLLVCLLPLWILLFQLALNRHPVLKLQMRMKRTLTIGFLTCVFFWVVLAIWEGAQFSHSLPSLFFYVTMSVLSIHLQFQFFNLSETARRIFLLTRLRQTGSLPTEEYTPQTMAKERVQRLIELGQIQESAEGLTSKTNGLVLAASLIKALEKLLFPHR